MSLSGENCISTVWFSSLYLFEGLNARLWEHKIKTSLMNLKCMVDENEGIFHVSSKRVD